MRQVEAQDSQLQRYGLSPEKLQTLERAQEALALAQYMKASLIHYLEGGIDRDVYILGSSQCFNLLIDKLNCAVQSLNIVDNV